MRFRTGGGSLTSLLLILLIGGFMGWKGALYSVQDQLTTPVGISPIEQAQLKPLNLDLFWEVLDVLESEYIDSATLDKETELYGAIKGLVNSLDDPYTVFMDPEETAEFQQSLDGTLKGIGAELTMRDGQLVVISPLKSSPAERAGLKSNDVIYMVDGDLVAEMTLFEAIMNIRGEEGTMVELTILREGLDEPLVMNIERATIEIPSVELEYVGPDENIAHISLYQFSDDTEREFDKAVQEILLKKVDGIILDMRYNGGGYLDVSVDILSDFIEGKKTAVITKYHDEADNEIFYTNESGLLKDFPLAVLVNEGSASASEIITGAIQDYERGIVIGTKTFGKGSVQVVERLDDGSSLRLTIAKWYTPLDRSIDEVGIPPNVEVTISDEDYANEVDPQLNHAIKYLEEL